MPLFKSGKKDLLIIAVILLAAFIAWGAHAFFFGFEQQAYAKIMYKGKTAKVVSLSKNLTFSIDGLPNVVFEVKDGKIAFVRSDCPDKICVKSGWLHTGGHSAACLPNQVVLLVFNGEEESVDGVVR